MTEAFREPPAARGAGPEILPTQVDDLSELTRTILGQVAGGFRYEQWDVAVSPGGSVVELNSRQEAGTQFKLHDSAGIFGVTRITASAAGTTIDSIALSDGAATITTIEFMQDSLPGRPLRHRSYPGRSLDVDEGLELRSQLAGIQRDGLPPAAIPRPRRWGLGRLLRFGGM